jgi:hypothetical protein
LRNSMRNILHISQEVNIKLALLQDINFKQTVLRQFSTSSRNRF